MIDKEPPAKQRVRMNVDTRVEPPDLRQNAREQPQMMPP